MQTPSRAMSLKNYTKEGPVFERAGRVKVHDMDGKTRTALLEKRNGPAKSKRVNDRNNFNAANFLQE